ncbi:MAG: hypothetical protein QF778_02840 [SAR324 cluster bacterium]|nr:hypothetical protein [SAR324 cluster bacterium]
MRKIILTVFAASGLLLYSTQAFALINFSFGVPISHTFTGKTTSGGDMESEGVSGTFIQIGVPLFPGIGVDSYKTKLKCATCAGDLHVATTIYNLYYLLPIPIVNLTIGVGAGNTKFECSGGMDCSWQDGGSATQWYTSIGMPILPLFDLHLSYRSVSSKIETTTGSDKGKKDDVGGNVMGLGIGFNF